MKILKEKTTKSFNPFNLIITVESKEEARALYAIFNSCRNSCLLHNADEIKQTIGDKYYVGEEEVIANGVTYENYYKDII